jgi:hypothetical protein
MMVKIPGPGRNNIATPSRSRVKPAAVLMMRPTQLIRVDGEMVMRFVTLIGPGAGPSGFKRRVRRARVW